ncbi:MAG: glycosyltransferase [Candidatus Krumholzibacteria bacterium]|nr:glycosyltransferase [Candidatus Krumholzibacteria bacterium]MDH4338092.1 glycosyltransferase [Candidatus Krumholzibacteria bacterium]MDH5270925.1 glycosyltransferase [Candidatus Krumholzibacteria bacterium]
MRVLFVNSIQMWGGAEVWLMDVMHGLAARGHTVTLACRPGTILEKNARAEGLDVVPVAMRSDFDPVVVANMVRLMRARDIDVISTNMDKELRFSGLAARLAGRIAVVPSREVDYPLKNKLRYRFTYNHLADHILANSAATKRSLLMNAPWLSPDRIEVIYKGIDPAPYLDGPQDGMALRAELGIADDAPVVGFVGQIIERKGIPDLVWSIPRVVEQLPGVRFLFVGKGMLVEFLLEKTRELGVERNVVHAGFRRDIPAVMKAIDLLVLPSVVEGFGYVLVEAMAAAKPVVATDVSSIPEIVQHDETGILVDVHNADQLAAAVLSVLRAPDRGRAMGERGRSVMLEKFTLQRMIDRIEAAFLATRARKRGGIDSH